MPKDKKPLNPFFPIPRPYLHDRIYRLLGAFRELNVTQISSYLKVTKTTVSQQLRKMEESGLLVSRIDENYPKNRIPPKIYMINPEFNPGNPIDPDYWEKTSEKKEKMMAVINTSRYSIFNITEMLKLVEEIYHNINENINIATTDSLKKAYDLYQKYLWGENGENIIWFFFSFMTENQYKFINSYNTWINERVNSPENDISEKELTTFQKSYKKILDESGDGTIPKEYGYFRIWLNNKNIFQFQRNVANIAKSGRKTYKKQPIGIEKKHQILILKPSSVDSKGNIPPLLELLREFAKKALPTFLIGQSEIKCKIWMVLEFFHELNVTQISKYLKEVKSTISRHLKAMEEMRIVESNNISIPHSHQISPKMYKIRNKPSEPHMRISPYPHPSLTNYSLKRSIEVIKQDIEQGLSAINIFRHIFGLVEPIFQEIEDLLDENSPESNDTAKKLFQDIKFRDNQKLLGDRFRLFLNYSVFSEEWWDAMSSTNIFFKYEMLSKHFDESMMQEFVKNKNHRKEKMEFLSRKYQRSYGNIIFLFPRSIFEYYKKKK